MLSMKASSIGHIFAVGSTMLHEVTSMRERQHDAPRDVLDTFTDTSDGSGIAERKGIGLVVCDGSHRTPKTTIVKARLPSAGVAA